MRMRLGPTVLAGLLTGGAATLAAGRPWVDLSVGDAAARAATGASTTAGTLSAHLPLAQALGLVLLACWGVLLVTRGRFRLAVAWLTVLTAAGLLATLVVGGFVVPDRAADALLEQGWVTRRPELSLGGWYWLALAGAALAVPVAVLAARSVRQWPEMGQRYDAPGATGATGAAGGAGAAGAGRAADPEPEEADPVDLWRALDQGRDPTSPDGP